MSENYFMINPATTADDLKKQREKLLLEDRLHPDHGGTNEQFTEMDRQYKSALDKINVFRVLSRADASGRQFLYELIDGIATLLQESKKYPEFSITIGVNVAKGLVNSIDAERWTSFLMKIINRHKK
jgi:hypothetical protein